MIEIKIGDCLDRMLDLEDNSVDAVICDPPHGIKFLEKFWDDIGHGARQRKWHKSWLEESYRVLKDGGMVKALSSGRTFHNLIYVMEEVGFKEVKVEAWVYASGMPTGNYDIAKGIEASILLGGVNKNIFKYLDGIRREGQHGYPKLRVEHGTRNTNYDLYGTPFELTPKTTQAKRHMGYGTTLKRSWEPICIGFKKES